MGYKNKIVLLEMLHIFVRKTPQNGFFLSQWEKKTTHFLGNIVKSQNSFLRAEIWRFKAAKNSHHQCFEGKLAEASLTQKMALTIMATWWPFSMANDGVCKSKSALDMQSFSGAMCEAGRGWLSTCGEEGAKTKYKLADTSGFIWTQEFCFSELTNLWVAVLLSFER